MQRDPLGRELTDCLLKMNLEPPEGPEREEISTRSDKLRSDLAKKYAVPDIYVLDPKHFRTLQAHQVSRDQIQAIAWTPVGLEAPIKVAKNWGDTIIEVQAPGPAKVRRVARPPAKEPPTLSITINLAQVTQWDLDRLAKQIKGAVREGLKALPDDFRRDPSPLGFLRTVSERQFSKDLRRYDLHMTHGLSFRLIALLEKLEKRGKTLPEKARSRPVRMNVPGESAVREAVARIYQAIYRKLYRARRRRLDAPAEGVSPYHCPEHGNGCSLQCKHLKEWWKRVQRTLPTDYSGARTILPIAESIP